MRTIVTGLLILVTPVLLTQRIATKDAIIGHIATCPHCRVAENSPMQCQEVLEISRANLPGTMHGGGRWTSGRGR